MAYASCAVPGFQGPRFEPTIVQVVLHLGYLNVFFGYPWLNPVFWTLAIELQYCLMVGLLFPLIANRSILIRSTAFGILPCLAFLVPVEQFLFHWIFPFMLGMAAFQFRTRIIERKQYFVWVVLLGIGAWSVGGLAIAVVGTGTTLLLAFVDATPKPLQFFGNISYSLYLLHIPVGGKVINLSMRFVHDTPGKIVVLAIALAMSVGAAWLLYKYVELPAQKWSARIRYRRKTIEPQLQKVCTATTIGG